MPVLSNQRRELYAQALAVGKSQQEAYVIAGYRAHPSNPSKLAKDKGIVARIAEIHSERATIHAEATRIAVEATGADKAWIMARLKENVERAMQAIPVVDKKTGEPTGEYNYEGSVANRALELLGKEQGMFVDRREVRTGELDRMDDADLDKRIAELEAQLSGIPALGGAAQEAEKAPNPRQLN